MTNSTDNLPHYKQIIESFKPSKIDRRYLDALRDALRVHGAYVDVYRDGDAVFVDIEESAQQIYEFRLSAKAILNV